MEHEPKNAPAIQLDLFDKEGNPINRTISTTEESNIPKNLENLVEETEKVDSKNSSVKPFMTIEEYETAKEDNKGLEWWQK